MRGNQLMAGLVLAMLVTAGCSQNEPEQPAPVEQVVQPVEQPDNDDAERERLERERLERERLARERAERERAREVLTMTIHFDYDESAIEGQAQDRMVQKASVLRTYDDVALRIEGHADERGSIEYNLALGLRRANAAKDFLTNYGLSASRFETVSFGEERPAARGSSESAWSQNRRAEFVVLRGLQ
ncbi:MAG: OmpA family protein [Longimicrobiales bacterium]